MYAYNIIICVWCVYDVNVHMHISTYCLMPASSKHTQFPCVYVYIYIYICMYWCLHPCTCLLTYPWMCPWTYRWIHIWMYLAVCIWTYPWRHPWTYPYIYLSTYCLTPVSSTHAQPPPQQDRLGTSIRSKSTWTAYERMHIINVLRYTYIICKHIYTYIPIYRWTYVYTYTHIYIYASVHIWIYTYVHIYIYIYVYMYTHIYRTNL